jgi:hypothetical protein
VLTRKRFKCPNYSVGLCIDEDKIKVSKLQFGVVCWAVKLQFVFVY